MTVKNSYKNYTIKADKVVLAMGRSGNKLIKDICKDNDIKFKNGRVDIGVRIECPNEVMEKLNNNFYECKIYFQGSFGDKARMFCTNPSGFVTVESYPYLDKNIYMANGHAYRNKHSNNTNFAILVSRNFNEGMEFIEESDLRCEADLSIEDDFYKQFPRVYKYAMAKTEKELMQAVQGMYHNLNY